MNLIIHERPGVYSSYDASSVIRGGRAVPGIGVAAKSVSGTANKPHVLTSYEAGLSVFGEDAPDAPGMSTMLRLLFQGGATTVTAVAVDPLKGYSAAFSVLEKENDIAIVVCDSGELKDQQELRASVARASDARRERIALVGMSGGTPSELVQRAAALNSERMVLVAPDVVDEYGVTLPGMFAAASAAAAVAVTLDPATPMSGAVLHGLRGTACLYEDNDIDLLVRGGVMPLETLGGVVSPVRGVTTRTKTGDVKDITWQELTTIRIVDDVIPTIRESLHSRFRRTKNTVQTRGAIRSQVIVELEGKKRAQIIDDYGDVRVSVYDKDPTVCLVEFGFAVAHGLNQIYITAHVTI